VVFIFAVSNSSNILAQQFEEDSTIAQKRDGSFSGHIASNVSSGIIERIYLSFRWSSIFDQPIEYYVNRWERETSSMQFDCRTFCDTTLFVSSLSAYPELLKRLERMRPSKVSIDLEIEVQGADAGQYIDKVNEGEECPVGFKNSQHYCTPYFTKTIQETPHLMIVDHGEVGDNITPTSPVNNWLGFFELDSLNMIDMDEEAVNKELDAMMRKASALRVGIVGVREEMSSAFSDLVEDFETCRNPVIDDSDKPDFCGESDEEEEENEEESKEEQIVEEDSSWDEEAGSDDFWSGNEVSSSDDDFWNDGNNADSEDSGFWSDPENYKNECTASYYTTWDSSRDECVELTKDADENARFGQQYGAGGAGVHVFDFPDRPAQGQRLNLRWNMNSVPDRAVVIYIDRGREITVFDTSMTSGRGTSELRGFSGDSVRLIMTGSSNDTQWDFTLSE
jgi:hypothetical protein